MKTLKETIDDPQNGSTNIVSVVICFSIIGINNFNSFLLLPMHPNGVVSGFDIIYNKVDNVNRGLYTVDGSIHPRKDLQLVKGNVIKAPTKTKAQQKQRDIQDKVGKSLNNPEVKDLVGVKTKKETKEILESGRKTRSQTAGTNMTLRNRNK